MSRRKQARPSRHLDSDGAPDVDRAKDADDATPDDGGSSPSKRLGGSSESEDPSTLAPPVVNGWRLRYDHLPPEALKSSAPIESDQQPTDAPGATRPAARLAAAAAAAALTGGATSPQALQELALLQSTLFTLQHQQVLQMSLIQQLQAQLQASALRDSSPEPTGLELAASKPSEERNLEAGGVTKAPTPPPDQHPSPQAGAAGEPDRVSVTDTPIIPQPPPLPADPAAAADTASSSTPPPSDTAAPTPTPTPDTGATSLASSVIPPSAVDAAPSANPLALLQQSTQQVLNNASQGLLAGNLVDAMYGAGGADGGERREAGSSRHRCRYCGKVFGSDSALQIHIRSHTGERPYKCNICGNRFTTKGNLKVHFQRHSARFPHVPMNAELVPEHLDALHPPLLAQLGELPESSPPPVPPAHFGSPLLGPPPLYSRALHEGAPTTTSGSEPPPSAAPVAGTTATGSTGGRHKPRPEPELSGSRRRSVSRSRRQRAVPPAGWPHPLAERFRELEALRRLLPPLKRPAELAPGDSGPLKRQAEEHTGPAKNEWVKEEPVGEKGLRLIKQEAHEDELSIKQKSNEKNLEDIVKDEPLLKREPVEQDRTEGAGGGCSLPADNDFPDVQRNSASPKDKDRGSASPERSPAMPRFPLFLHPAAGPPRIPSSLPLSLLPGAPPLQPSFAPFLGLPPDLDPAKDPHIYSNLLPRPGVNDNTWEALIEVEKTSETSKLQSLVDNIENSVTEPNQCVVCQRVLSCKSALQMHYRTHTGERPFRCKICGRAFTTKGNLKTHMGVHRTKPPLRAPHQCPVCHRRFPSALVLQQHIRLHTGRPADLPPSFPATLPAARHPAGLPVEFPVRFPVRFPAGFEAGFPLPAAPPFALRARQLSEADRPSLVTSLTGARSPEPSGDESLGSPRWTSGGSSPRLDGASPGSAGSGASPPLALDLTPAASGALPSPPRPPAGQLHHFRLPSQLLGAHLPAGVGSTTCSLCFKVFACQSALEIHYRSHTKERPFQCPRCQKGFTTKGNLSQHMLTHQRLDRSPPEQYAERNADTPGAAAEPRSHPSTGKDAPDTVEGDASADQFPVASAREAGELISRACDVTIPHEVTTEGP